MDLTGTKAIVLVLLGMIKLISGLAPLVLTKILKRRSDRFLKKFIGVVLCFGGGVLLSTVFIHMVTEVRESLERATTMGMIPVEMEFPFAELLICMGFLLILLIESVVHKFFGGHGHSHFPSQETLANKFVGVEDIGVTIPEEAISSSHYNSGYESESPHKLNYSSSVKITQPRNTTATHPDLTIAERGSPFSSNKKVGGNVYNVSSASLTSYTTHTSDSDSLSNEPSVGTSSSKSDIKSQRNEKKMLTSLRSFLMVLALSIHSIFEGMAIGLEETEMGVWKLFLAVSIHATAIVFCIGTEMISSGTKRLKIVIYMVVLSIVTPIGVLIGIIVTVHMEQASGEHVLVIGVLQGLAGGTLLYITFFEVLARDKLSKYGMSGLLGALAVMVGFTVMAAMEAGAGGHSHGGHGGHEGHGGHAVDAHEQHSGKHNVEHDQPGYDSFHGLKFNKFDENRYGNEHDHGNGQNHEGHNHENEHNHAGEHHQENKNNHEDGHDHKDENNHEGEHTQEDGHNNTVGHNHEDEHNHNEHNNRDEHNNGSAHNHEDYHNHDDFHNPKDAHNHEEAHNHEDAHNNGGEHNHEDAHNHEEENDQEDEHSHEDELNHNHEHGHADDHGNEGEHGQEDDHGHEGDHDHEDEHNHEDHITNDNKQFNMNEKSIEDEHNHEHHMNESLNNTKIESNNELAENLDHEHNNNENTTSDDYFVYNVTDYKFMHDNVAYD